MRTDHWVGVVRYLEPWDFTNAMCVCKAWKAVFDNEKAWIIMRNNHWPDYPQVRKSWSLLGRSITNLMRGRLVPVPPFPLQDHKRVHVRCLDDHIVLSKHSYQKGWGRSLMGNDLADSVERNVRTFSKRAYTWLLGDCVGQPLSDLACWAGLGLTGVSHAESPVDYDLCLLKPGQKIVNLERAKSTPLAFSVSLCMEELRGRHLLFGLRANDETSHPWSKSTPKTVGVIDLDTGQTLWTHSNAKLQKELANPAGGLSVFGLVQGIPCLVRWDDRPFLHDLQAGLPDEGIIAKILIYDALTGRRLGEHKLASFGSMFQTPEKRLLWRDRSQDAPLFEIGFQGLREVDKPSTMWKLAGRGLEEVDKRRPMQIARNVVIASEDDYYTWGPYVVATKRGRVELADQEACSLEVHFTAQRGFRVRWNTYTRTESGSERILNLWATLPENDEVDDKSL